MYTCVSVFCKDSQKRILRGFARTNRWTRDTRDTAKEMRFRYNKYREASKLGVCLGIFGAEANTPQPGD